MKHISILDKNVYNSRTVAHAGLVRGKPHACIRLSAVVMYFLVTKPDNMKHWHKVDGNCGNDIEYSWT